MSKSNTYSKEIIDKAEFLYINTTKNLKQISEDLNISRNTLQTWKQKYKWVKNDKYIAEYKYNINKNKVKPKDATYYKAKDLYENTALSVPKICEITGYTKDMLWGRIKRFNWVRPKELKTLMKSNTAKQINRNLTEAEKKIKTNKQSKSNKNIWKLRTEQEIKNITNKRLQTIKEKSEEEINQIHLKISASMKKYWENMSEEDRIAFRKKLSYAQQHLDVATQESKLLKDRATKHKNNSFKNAVALDGTKFDSKYEADVYDFCKRNNIPLERDIPIKHFKNGKEYITYIDFKIDNILFECKGTHLLEGVYDYDKEIKIEDKLEIYKNNNVILISSKASRYLIPPKNSKLSNGLKYKSKCPNPLICVDIDLFRKPDFPYAEDKPECFYKVKVDNKLSAIEAWKDENLRWKMIKNRINYVGGFIDSKSILTAMNVTRNCKQPSWFDKNYAKALIQKYITSDIVLDTFAGWGTRCDACKELGIHYYGWDLNKELVDWHHSKGRLFETGCGIEYADANEVKTVRENCSVFICPPYTDFEVYFKSQDIETTQCQWLAKVMKNIPNAREYLMVCKVVDEGWEKYIVEEKINKSHLGSNKEYVLLVKNKF